MALMMDRYIDVDIGKLSPDKQVQAALWFEDKYCPDCPGYRHKKKDRQAREIGMVYKDEQEDEVVNVRYDDEPIIEEENKDGPV